MCPLFNFLYKHNSYAFLLLFINALIVSLDLCTGVFLLSSIIIKKSDVLKFTPKFFLERQFVHYFY